MNQVTPTKMGDSKPRPSTHDTAGPFSCPACGRLASGPALEEFHAYSLFACPLCGLQFWEPRAMPDAQWYERMYAGRDARLLPLEPGHRFFLKDAGFLPHGNLLDVGCGTGNFLLAARDAGFSVNGIELDISAARFAKHKCGLPNILPLTLAEFASQFPEEKFDVITFFEVLEHQASPGQFLSDAKACLCPGGYMALSVPNRERWRVGMDPLDYPPNHFLRWDGKSLKKVLAFHGFDVLSVREGTASISYAAQMINILLRTGMSRSLAPDLPPVFREAMQNPDKLPSSSPQPSFSLRLRAVQALGRLKAMACLPIACLSMPIIRLRGYKDSYLYCLARRRD